MNISLKSRSEIVSWASLFRLLGYELCVPLWGILDLPREIIEQPKKILDVSKGFFKGGSSLWTGEVMTTDEEAANHLEAQRMIDLGVLYDCFGLIVKFYGEEAAIRLYEWGERYFIHEKEVFWWTWDGVFAKLLRNRVALADDLDQVETERALTIIREQFERQTHREKRLETEFEKFCREFSADPEQLNLLNNVSVSDITIFNNFDDAADEFENIFGFTLILAKDGAYKIWRRFNTELEAPTQEKIFQWGLKEAEGLAGGITEDLKSYCLNI